MLNLSIPALMKVSGYCAGSLICIPNSSTIHRVLPAPRRSVSIEPEPHHLASFNQKEKIDLMFSVIYGRLCTGLLYIYQISLTPGSESININSSLLPTIFFVLIARAPHHKNWDVTLHLILAVDFYTVKFMSCFWHSIVICSGVALGVPWWNHSSYVTSLHIW